MCTLLLKWATETIRVRARRRKSCQLLKYTLTRDSWIPPLEKGKFLICSQYLCDEPPFLLWRQRKLWSTSWSFFVKAQQQNAIHLHTLHYRCLRFSRKAKIFQMLSKIYHILILLCCKFKIFRTLLVAKRGIPLTVPFSNSGHVSNFCVSKAIQCCWKQEIK